MCDTRDATTVRSTMRGLTMGEVSTAQYWRTGIICYGHPSLLFMLDSLYLSPVFVVILDSSWLTLASRLLQVTCSLLSSIPSMTAYPNVELVLVDGHMPASLLRDCPSAVRLVSIWGLWCRVRGWLSHAIVMDCGWGYYGINTFSFVWFCTRSYSTCGSLGCRAEGS